MVAQRRFGPLIVAVFVALSVLFVRLFQVQVVEHDLWARQADGLISSSKVIPGERGRILDRNGGVLVEDEPMYQIELCYRDFRREHPLGILAHARSTMAMRAVSLAEAYEHRAEWTADLLATSQTDLGNLAAGRAWKSGASTWPAAGKDREQCARRAVDVRFYVGQLLDLDKTDSDRLRKLQGADQARTFADVIATARSIAPEVLLARVQAHVEEACGELSLLADILPRDADRAGDVTDAQAGSKSSNSKRSASEQSRSGATRAHGDVPGSVPMQRLLAALEDVRRDVEDEAADDLFHDAADFDVGEVSTHALQSAFDLDWIRASLCWDRARLDEWTASRRAERDVRIELGLLPRMLVQVEFADDEHAPERLLDELARLWRTDPQRDEDGRPPSWREMDDLVVLSEIDTLFADARLPHGVDVPALVLPFQDEELRDAPVDPKSPWHVVGMLSDLAGKDDSGEVEPLREPSATAFWEEHSSNRAALESVETREELARIVRALDRRHAAAADRLFASLVSAHGGDATQMRFSEERMRRAENNEKYVLVDQGNRPAYLFTEPPYALVERIARHPDSFGGLSVSETTRRVQRVRDEHGRPCAALLVGDVRKPQLRETLKHSDDERRLRELKSLSSLSEDEAHELEALNGRTRSADVATGGFGIEAYLDRELRAIPGSYETEGLEERARTGNRSRTQPPQKGQDVQLTIDPKLQIAVQELLDAPRMPRDLGTDRTWFANPVAAIALITPDGDVLAAASAPDESGLEPAEGRDDERMYRRERTLQSPTFQPPGSVFKPFVAAYALAKLGFDPETTFQCVDPKSETHGRFETMHCLERHNTIGLHRALWESCNAYFAQLGLRFDTSQCLDMMHTFGFGEPTGILCFGKKGRSGLIENVCDHQKRLAKQLDVRRMHLQFSNGLAVVEATPMQVARAMAGIATGSLPDVRLIQSIGGKEIPHVARPLGFDEQSLAIVRADLHGVVERGTAATIDQHKIGFSFACKTGSADYRQFETADPSSGAETKKLLKHTWIAGYFPAESPRAIVVVFLHETAETSTHTAVFLAEEFLELPAVRDFATRELAGAAR